MIRELLLNGKVIILIYLILNVISFSMFAVDKRRAIKGEWRISEAALITSAVFGIFGGFCGMYIMHHKTKKPKFYIGLPVILIMEIAAAVFLIIRFKEF